MGSRASASAASSGGGEGMIFSSWRARRLSGFFSNINRFPRADRAAGGPARRVARPDPEFEVHGAGPEAPKSAARGLFQHPALLATQLDTRPSSKKNGSGCPKARGRSLEAQRVFVWQRRSRSPGRAA